MRRNEKTKNEPPQVFSRRGKASRLGPDAMEHAAAAIARAGFADATLVLRWAEIAGPDLARLAEPVKWQEDPGGAVLTLKCESGAALFLQHQTRELLAALNGYLGAGRCARIRLVPGRLSRAQAIPDHPRNGLPREPGADLGTALARLAKVRVKARRRP